MNKDWKSAVQNSDLQRIRLFLENGADINAKDEHGQTALMIAAHKGQIELARLLIEQGADLNQTSKYNLSALMLAIIAHHTEIAALLIEAGADVNIHGSKNFYGKTALSLAEYNDEIKIVNLLKQKESGTQS